MKPLSYAAKIAINDSAKCVECNTGGQRFPKSGCGGIFAMVDQLGAVVKILRKGFACALLIDTFGRFLLQQRDNVPGILYPGKVGLFGGHREEGETYLQCVVREVHEEISFFLAPERFRHLVTYKETVEVTGTTRYGEIFIARDIDVKKLNVTEGALLIMTPDELTAVRPKLSPSARLALMAYLSRCSCG
jgi:8-oxo-dGTP diphosphatase